MMDPPAEAAAAHNEGVALARAGQYALATTSFLRAVELSGREVHPRILKGLWETAIRAEEWRTGIAAGFEAARRDPTHSAFVNDVLQSLARCPLAALVSEERFPTVQPPPSWPTLSVIIVSVDDDRYEAVSGEFDRAFAAWPHERIRVKGAPSMYAGFADGFARSRGELVVFCHDDIRFAVPDFAARLAGAMQDADMAGVAGTTKVSGPALLWAGHPYLFGSITQKDPTEAHFEFAVSSLAGPRVGAAQGIDGVFIAVRRPWVERLGFDPDRFTHFHFYDIDFSYRAFLAGARVTIAADLGLIHRSRGSFDERWLEAQQAFSRKFHFAGEPPGRDRHWYSVRLPDEAAVTAMYAKLLAAWELRLIP